MKTEHSDSPIEAFQDINGKVTAMDDTTTKDGWIYRDTNGAWPVLPEFGQMCNIMVGNATYSRYVGSAAVHLSGGAFSESGVVTWSDSVKAYRTIPHPAEIERDNLRKENAELRERLESMQGAAGEEKREIVFPIADDDGWHMWEDGSCVGPSLDSDSKGKWFATDDGHQTGFFDTREDAAKWLISLKCGPYHARQEKPAGPQPAQPEPIPIGVWWDDSEMCFVRINRSVWTSKEYVAFHNEWIVRRAEFPQSREEAERRMKDAADRESLRKEVADKTVSRLKKFTEAIESGKLKLAKDADKPIQKVSAFFGLPPADKPQSREVHPDPQTFDVIDMVESIRRQLMEMHGQAADYTARRFTLSARQVEGELAEVLTKVQQVQIEIDQMMARLATSADTILKLSARGAELEKEIQQRESARVTARDIRDGLKKRIAELESQLAEATKECGRLKSQPAQLDTAMHNPDDVPQSPWVVIRLHNGAEMPAFYQTSGRFVTEVGEFIAEDVTGWRYATQPATGIDAAEYERRMLAFFDEYATNAWITVADLIRKHFPQSAFAPPGQRFEGWCSLNRDGTPYQVDFVRRWDDQPSCTVFIHGKAGE